MNYIECMQIVNEFASSCGMDKTAALLKIASPQKAGKRAKPTHSNQQQYNRKTKNIARGQRNAAQQVRAINGMANANGGKQITDRQAQEIFNDTAAKGVKPEQFKKRVNYKNGQIQQRAIENMGNRAISIDASQGAQVPGISIHGGKIKNLNKDMKVGAPNLEGGDRTRFRTGKYTPKDVAVPEGYRDAKALENLRADMQGKIDSVWKDYNNMHKKYTEAVASAAAERAAAKSNYGRFNHQLERLDSKYRGEVSGRAADAEIAARKLRRSRILSGLGLGATGIGAYYAGSRRGGDEEVA